MAAEPRPELHRVVNAALVSAFAAVASLAAAGLVLAPAHPAASGSAGEILFFAFGLGFPLAAALALGVGLPLYLLLRRRWALTAGRAMAAGCAVGAAPWLALGLASGTPVEAMTGPLGFGALPGAVGGLVFWAMLRR